MENMTDRNIALADNTGALLMINKKERRLLESFWP